jgi:hypothetical protein
VRVRPTALQRADAQQLLRRVIVLPEPTGPISPQMNARLRRNASAIGPGEVRRRSWVT